MVLKRVAWLSAIAVLALVAVPAGGASQVSQAAGVRQGLHQTGQWWHLSSSLVPSPGAQVAHVDGILKLSPNGSGDLGGSTLRLSTGPTVQVTGSLTRTLNLSMNVDGMQVQGESSAMSDNRISGEYHNASGGSIGFWVATAIKDNRAGARYTVTSRVASGPDKGTTYDGSLELWGDRYGGLLGWLTLKDGSVLNVSGQDVNGNLNMGVIVRSGTPMTLSGTTMVDGSLHGTVVGPLAGDEGDWTAGK
jgi:hypothetical protein